MITCSLDQFMLQIKDGSFNNVGAANKRATVKLYDIETTTVREFGDERVKLEFTDDDGNEVEVALFPDQITDLREQIEDIETGPLFD